MAAGGRKTEKSPRKRKAAKPKGRRAPSGRCGAALSLQCTVKRSPCGRYVAELVSRLRPGHMSARAKRLMDTSMCVLCRGVVSEADRRRRRRRGSFIGSSEMRAALATVMKGRGGVYGASAAHGRRRPPPLHEKSGKRKGNRSKSSPERPYVASTSSRLL